jgi:hypothetical protein
MRHNAVTPMQLYFAEPLLLLLFLLHLHRLEPSLLTSLCRRVQCGMRRWEVPPSLARQASH